LDSLEVITTVGEYWFLAELIQTRSQSLKVDFHDRLPAFKDKG